MKDQKFWDKQLIDGLAFKFAKKPGNVSEQEGFPEVITKLNYSIVARSVGSDRASFVVETRRMIPYRQEKLTKMMIFCFDLACNIDEDLPYEEGEYAFDAFSCDRAKSQEDFQLLADTVQNEGIIKCMRTYFTKFALVEPTIISSKEEDLTLKDSAQALA